MKDLSNDSVARRRTPVLPHGQDLGQRDSFNPNSFDPSILQFVVNFPRQTKTDRTRDRFVHVVNPRQIFRARRRAEDIITSQRNYGNALFFIVFDGLAMFVDSQNI